jgi:hypothetical protein
MDRLHMKHSKSRNTIVSFKADFIKFTLQILRIFFMIISWIVLNSIGCSLYKSTH